MREFRGFTIQSTISNSAYSELEEMVDTISDSEELVDNVRDPKSV